MLVEPVAESALTAPLAVDLRLLSVMAVRPKLTVALSAKETTPTESPTRR
jgi:hypothetical protein